MIAFAAACDAIAAAPAKLAKIERLATYFRSLEAADLRAAARFLSGNPLAAHDDRKLAIGGRTLLAAADRVWGASEAALSAAYTATGDLGETLARVAREPADPGLFAETLTPAALARMLDELASSEGKSAGKRRQAVCERAYRACRDPREVAYVTKILTGELRIGLREGLVLDAIARAFERDAATVRRAAMAAGDVGAVALAAQAGSLEQIAIRYGAPIGYMLATPMAFGSSYRELAAGTWLVEDKYDGIRAQAHLRHGTVRLFSRTFSEISRAFPEVVAALKHCPHDAIFDGEIVARRDGVVLPFRYLQPRLQRIDPPPELQAEIPAQFLVFDVLAAGDRFLLDEPLVERRAQVAALVLASDHLALAAWHTLETGTTPETIAELFNAARARGNEGLMLKRTDAPYVPGRRGKWWLKLKRELSTLDVVVIGVEWGHGKRRKVLSDYTFAVRRSQGDPTLLAIGKAYSGLTDAEIAEQTAWFLEHRTGVLADSRHAMAVEPHVVIEIAFDIIQKSTLHASGFSLR
ncbi:MAG: DNA ligase, partial [Candidatus Eremiobacteraeota bacterium]|nr:DNA ligase [Candidatus Eremiobacteraeota bacterium]